jgi:hypothetical protein
MPFRPFAGCFALLALFAFTFAYSQDQADLISRTPGAISDSNETTAANPMTITADLTDAPRKLLHAEIEIPVKPGPFTFTAAKWIPEITAQPVTSVTSLASSSPAMDSPLPGGATTSICMPSTLMFLRA